MGIFDDWAAKRKWMRLAVIFSAFLALTAGVFSNSASILAALSKDRKLYSDNVRVIPFHLMFGRLPSEDEIALGPLSTLDALAAHVVGDLSSIAARRGFKDSGLEEYTVRLEGDKLFVSGTGDTWRAFLYAIAPEIDEEDVRYVGVDAAAAGVPSSEFFGRVAAIPPMGQILRELHVIPLDGYYIDLSKYFGPQAEWSFFTEVSRTCDCLTLTFHGSNGQFRGEIIRIIRKDDGTYSFYDGSMAREIRVPVRKAKVLLIPGDPTSTASPLLNRMQAIIRQSDAVDTPSPEFATMDDIETVASRVRTMPLIQAREEFLDRNAVDFIAIVTLTETSSKVPFWR